MVHYQTIIEETVIALLASILTTVSVPWLNKMCTSKDVLGVWLRFTFIGMFGKYVGERELCPLVVYMYTRQVQVV